jgi:hypothetical protein
MLSQYKNIEQILTAQGAVSAQRYPQTLLNLFETNYYSYIPDPEYLYKLQTIELNFTYIPEKHG